MILLQDLLDTIQKLQNQLAALQKTQYTMSQTTPGPSHEDIGQIQENPVGESSKKRPAEDSWEPIQGSTYSELKLHTGKKKGKKEKKLKTFDFTR